MYCKECGGQEFVNQASSLGIIRTCRGCGYQFPALQDHLHAEPPKKEEPVVEKEEQVEEVDTTPKRRTRKASPKGE